MNVQQNQQAYLHTSINQSIREEVAAEIVASEYALAT